MTLFVLLLVLTASTRLIEMNISRRHRQKLFAQGAAPAADPGFLWMVILHVGILLGSLIEVVAVERSAPQWLTIAAALGVLGASALRVWAIHSLGQHWNVRVVNSTALGVIQRGPYQYIRHPNYVAVFAELALLPLVQGAWISFAVGTTLHLWVLYRRIGHEEEMLLKSPEYQTKMADKPRFIPNLIRFNRQIHSARHM